MAAILVAENVSTLSDKPVAKRSTREGSDRSRDPCRLLEEIVNRPGSTWQRKIFLAGGWILGVMTHPSTVVMVSTVRRRIDRKWRRGPDCQSYLNQLSSIPSGRFRHTRWRRCADPSREFPPQFNTRGQDVTSSDSSRRFSRLPRAAYPTNRQRDDHHVSFSRHNFSARHAPVPTEASCAKGRCHHQGLYGRHELGSAESSTDLRKRSRRCHRGGPPVGGQG